MRPHIQQGKDKALETENEALKTECEDMKREATIANPTQSPRFDANSKEEEKQHEPRDQCVIRG